MKQGLRVSFRALALAVVVGVGGALVGAAAPAQATVPRAPVSAVRQWQLGAVEAPAAQRVSTGAGVTVAVIDSGVDATRPTLAGQVLPGAQFGQPTSPTGQIDTAKTKGHGTLVAGIVAGKGGPGTLDPLGIAPGAKILPIAVDESSLNIATAVTWAVDHGARVINLSLIGRGPAPPALEQAVREAISRDVVVVASAGNVDQTGPAVSNPASIPGVLAVSGVDQNLGMWTNSATGPEVGISAPAVKVVGPVPASVGADGLAAGDGTSFASPIVAGVAALIRARYPTMNAVNVINRLVRTATDRGAPGRDPQFGYGTVRADAALTASVPKVTDNPLLDPVGTPGGEIAPSPATEVVTPTPAAEKPRPAGLSEGMTTLAIIILCVIPAMIVIGVFVTIRDTRRSRRLAAAQTGFTPDGWPVHSQQGAWPTYPQPDVTTGSLPSQPGPPASHGSPADPNWAPPTYDSTAAPGQRFPVENNQGSTVAHSGSGHRPPSPPSNGYPAPYVPPTPGSPPTRGIPAHGAPPAPDAGRPNQNRGN